MAEIGTRDDTCPYCGDALGRSPRRSAACGSCGGVYRVRDRKREDGRRVLTQTEALFLEALRGGALVPELFSYDPLSVRSAEDVPHNRPEVQAAAEAEVNRRWAAMPSASGPKEYLWEHYEGQANGEGIGHLSYARFRQGQLLMAENDPLGALRYVLVALYVDVADGAATRADLGLSTGDPLDGYRTGERAIPSAWLGLAADALQTLGAEFDLEAEYQQSTAHWQMNNRWAAPETVWAIIRDRLRE